MTQTTSLGRKQLVHCAAAGGGKCLECRVFDFLGTAVKDSTRLELFEFAIAVFLAEDPEYVDNSRETVTAAREPADTSASARFLSTMNISYNR